MPPVAVVTVILSSPLPAKISPPLMVLMAILSAALLVVKEPPDISKPVITPPVSTLPATFAATDVLWLT